MGRNEIIHKAVKDKLGLRIEIFSSNDILTVAGISQSEIEKLAQQLESNIEALTESKGYPIVEY